MPGAVKRKTSSIPSMMRLISLGASVGKVRAKVEHVFRVVNLSSAIKVGYRGIAKNGARVFALFTLANLYLVRGR
jgi:hypothetical protein